MKILFSISKKHFDATTGKILIRHSAGILSKLFYEAIKDLGEIDVIDSKDCSLIGKNYDLLIGLPRNFKFLTQNNNIKVATCFPNICEGNQLKRVLREEAARLGCKVRDAYAPNDYYHADHLFVIGGQHIVDGFLKVGIPRNKITDLYWRSENVPFKFREKNKRTVFLHSATTFGLRKGTWYVIEDFKKTNIDAELWLMGATQKEKFWIDYINDATKDPRIKNFGWISNDDKRYIDVIHGADYIVFPSFGEGQPGTVTEAMEGGCLPMISEESGINLLNYYKRGDSTIFIKNNDISNTEYRDRQDSLKKYIERTFDNKVFVKTVKNKLKELCNI